MAFLPSLSVAGGVAVTSLVARRWQQSVRLVDALIDGVPQRATIVTNQRPSRSMPHSAHDQRGMVNGMATALRGVQTQSTAWVQTMAAPFISESRLQQLAEITGKRSSDDNPLEKEGKRNLIVSSVGFLCVSAGALFFPPLYVPGIAGILYVYSFLFKDAFHALIHERRINGNMLISVLTMGALAGGYFFAMALAVWQGAIIRWLLAKTNNASRKGLVNLFGEQPRFVWVVTDGVEVEVPFASLQIMSRQGILIKGSHIDYPGVGSLLLQATSKMAQRQNYKGLISKDSKKMMQELSTLEGFECVSAIDYHSFIYQGATPFRKITDASSCKLMLKRFTA